MFNRQLQSLKELLGEPSKESNVLTKEDLQRIYVVLALYDKNNTELINKVKNLIKEESI